MAKDSLLTWDFKPTHKKAIYSLVDEDGKRYVGETSNLYQRLYAHRKCLDYAHQHLEDWFYYNQRLIRAARCGMRFKAEVLRELADDTSKNEMYFWEGYYINKFGNTYLSYNIDPPSYIGKVPWNKKGIYVFKKKDCNTIEAAENAVIAQKLIEKADYRYIDYRLLEVVTMPPKGLKSLVG